MESSNKILTHNRKRVLPSNVVRKPTGLKFDGYFFDFIKFKFWGFTEIINPFNVKRMWFELDLHEYPITHECIINEVMIAP